MSDIPSSECSKHRVQLPDSRGHGGTLILSGNRLLVVVQKPTVRTISPGKPFFLGALNGACLSSREIDMSDAFQLCSVVTKHTIHLP